MIEISSADWRDGLLAALSRTSTRIIHEMMGSPPGRVPAESLGKVRQLLTHKDPHIDEYMAMLLFKASLPEKYWAMPMDEVVLSSASHDHKAMATWPEAAVFGIGKTHSGGARPALVYDEHVPEGKIRKENSATMLVRKMVLGNTRLPKPLFQLCSEIDHIDAYGNAHPKHLGNYLKRMHLAEYTFHKDSSAIWSDVLTPAWKQALVEACIVSVLLGIQEKLPFSRPDYWSRPVKDSLDHYAKHTLLKDLPGFDDAWNRLRSNMLNFKGDHLKITAEDGTRKNLRVGNAEPWQLLVMPYLAGLCQDFWGPELGQIILVHFWEARILSMLDFDVVMRSLNDTVGRGIDDCSGMSTPAGIIDFRRLPLSAPGRDGTKRNVWLIGLQLEGRIHDAKSAMINFLAKANDGVGYVLLKNAVTGAIVLSKGMNVPSSQWEALAGRLVEREGSSDTLPVAGCWHVTRNAQGRLADFLLNGNAAHQYVPRTVLSVDLLADFLQER